MKTAVFMNDEMEALFNDYPFKSVKKFVPLAIKHGFTKQEAIEFLGSLAHDKKYDRQTRMMLPIFGRHPNSYQMDTLVQTKNANPRYYLIIININSRKLYAYPMKAKDSKEVLKALNTFIKQVKTIYSITSDQDAAYLDSKITKFMTDNHIDHQTTFTNDHNRLGIINRAIKTLRDLNNERDFTQQSMTKALNAYNNSVHSSINKEPNDFTNEDEEQYIANKEIETNLKMNMFNLPNNTYVRIMSSSTPMKKKRLNLSDGSYKVAYKTGNKYVIKALDNTAAEFPRYRLVPDSKAKPAQTLQTNRAIINDILEFKNGKYRVRYDNNSIDTLPIRNLREGRPTRLSPLELQYWRKQKQIPSSIRALMH